MAMDYTTWETKYVQQGLKIFKKDTSPNYVNDYQ